MVENVGVLIWGGFLSVTIFLLGLILMAQKWVNPGMTEKIGLAGAVFGAICLIVMTIFTTLDIVEGIPIKIENLKEGVIYECGGPPTEGYLKVRTLKNPEWRFVYGFPPLFQGEKFLIEGGIIFKQ